MVMEKMLRPLRAMSTFGAVLVTLFIVPMSSLKVHGAFSIWHFLALVLVPGALLLVAKGTAAIANRSLISPLLTVLAGVCEGLALALGLEGFITAYFWYQDPGKPHLEPLFVLIGLAAVTAESCSRGIRAMVGADIKNGQEESA